MKKKSMILGAKLTRTESKLVGGRITEKQCKLSNCNIHAGCYCNDNICVC